MRSGRAASWFHAGRVAGGDPRHHRHFDRAVLAGRPVGTGSGLGGPNVPATCGRWGWRSARICDVHKGLWPQTTGSAGINSDSTTGLYTTAWIYTVAPFMEDVDAIRICPDDPNGNARKAIKMTSYVLNAYLSTECPPPNYLNAWKLKETSKTIIMFEVADSNSSATHGRSRPLLQVVFEVRRFAERCLECHHRRGAS